MSKKYLLTLSLSLAAATFLSAEEGSFEGITVKSDYFNPSSKQAPYASEIYTDKEIKESKARTVYEFLSASSMTSITHYGNPYSQKMDMRGFGAANGYQNIVITINGRRLNNIDSIPQALSGIPLESIQQIEILKGSSGVLNGDGATAGSINIITKKEHGIALGAEMGSYSTASGYLNGGYYGDMVGLSAYVKGETTQGARDIDSQNNTDEKRNSVKGFSLSYYPSEKYLFEIGASEQQYDVLYANALTQSAFDEDPSQVGVSFYGSTYTEQEYYGNERYAAATFFPTKALELNLRYGMEDKKNTYVLSSYEALYDSDSLHAHIKYAANGFEGILGFERREGERETTSNTMEKENTGYFLKLAYTLDKFRLEGGYRAETIDYDYAPKSGTSLSDDLNEHALDLGLNYRMNPEWNLFASYGKGFQTPDVDNFFDSFNNQFNGFIEPMRTQTYQLGANWAKGGNHFSGTLFYILVDDEIFLDPASTTFFLNVNLEESKKQGIELSGRYLLNQYWALSGNYSYVDATIEKGYGGNYDGNTLPGVSKHNLSLGVSYAATALTDLTLRHKYRSEAYNETDFSNSATQKTKAYNSTDFIVSHRIKQAESIEIYATITNLFDNQNGHWVRDDAVYPINFERTYALGVKAKF